MTLIIKDPVTDAKVRELAKLEGKSLTETVRDAVDAQLKAKLEKVPLGERLDALTREFAKYPRTGLKADKAWFDEMWGEED
jgi:antitoxin VapB